MLSPWDHVQTKDVFSLGLFTIVLTVLPIPSTQRQGKKIKGIEVGKEEMKLSLFANDMVIYVENPKESTTKILELISEYSKVTDTNYCIKINWFFIY